MRNGRTHLLQGPVQRLRRLGRGEVAQQQLLGRHLRAVEVSVGVLTGDHGGRLEGDSDEDALGVGVRESGGYTAVAGSDVGRRRAADRPDGEAQLGSEGYLSGGTGLKEDGGRYVSVAALLIRSYRGNGRSLGAEKG